MISPQVGNTALTGGGFLWRRYLFRKCIFSYKSDFLSGCNGFFVTVAVPQKKQKSTVVTHL